jgi:hypothetical protein
MEAIMAEQHLITAEFFGTPVSILDHAGKRWLTAEQIGKCLGYANDNARKGINKLYNAHADEFTDMDKGVAELATPGGIQSVLIFSATGCIKLGFFANTATAKQFRAWAAQTLEAAAPAPQPAAPPAPALPGVRMTRRKERLAMEGFVAGQTAQDIGRALGVSRSTISLTLCGKYQFSLGAGAPECSRELIAAVAARHLAIEQQRLAAAQERIAQRYLSLANNQALADALEQVGRQLQQAPLRALGGAQEGQ